MTASAPRTESGAGLNRTHAPTLRSWVASANGHPDFPIQNLPFGVFRRAGGEPHVGIAIGDTILDVAAALDAGLLRSAAAAAELCRAPTLNPLMAAPPAEVSALRAEVSALLDADGAAYRERGTALERLLVPTSEAELLVPAAIGDYTDFYASIHHATNVGSMFRPDNPLLPNYKWVPIGYHGRASSIVPSGARIRRPSGQTRDDASAPPSFGPSRRLDYELEVGIFVAGGNPLGQPIPAAEAERHIFGLCLVNDWSARDIQPWEYQPLGPFLAKSFATTVSPWVVTLEALAPFRVPAAARPEGDPAPLPYLSALSLAERGGVALTLEVWLRTAAMRERGIEAVRLSQGSFADMYWTIGQLLTHHASNGCNLRPGDLLGSGTVSGPERGMRGSMLELSWRGTEPIALPGGETRRFLEDGDEVILRGWTEREGFARIGLGECRGLVAGSV
jgi:fumarylacetoacetase